MTSDEKIRSAYANKDWQEIKVTDSWQIFKIMAEFVDGFEKLAKIGPCVSIFGSARTPRNESILPDCGRNRKVANGSWLRSDYWWWSRDHGGGQ